MSTGVLIGILLAAALAWTWRSRRKPLMPESLYRVSVSDTELVCTFPDGAVQRLAWKELTQVAIRTTSEGPWAPDLFWGFHGADGEPAVVVPGGASGEDALMKALEVHLEGIDYEALIAAQSSTSDAFFVVWRAPPHA